MIRQALMRFMYGRNGIDQLGTFMLVLYLLEDMLSNCLPYMIISGNDSVNAQNVNNM